MCDTILAPAESTAEHVTLFGKNSDRQRNEAQAIEYFHRTDHQRSAQLACTYIIIPQVQRTHAVLLCRPFWMWGAEMGANEHGVVIGNEALHARSPGPQEEALTGEDLLRLALERAGTAAEAVDVITTLLEQYGQGGNCGHLTPSYFNNGFMVADAREAFVLETLDKEWFVERVADVRAMSNRYSISYEVERVSAGLPTLIRNFGWTDETKVDYAGAIADPHTEHIGNAKARRTCSTSLLNSQNGRLNVAHMMSILRDHGSGDRFHPEWRDACVVERTLCMHAGADDRRGQTAGSMISELRNKVAVHWMTGTAAPCTAIFKPMLMDASLPSHGPLLTDHFDANTLWWRHERLHRTAILGDFAKFLDDIRAERDALEAEFRIRVNEVLNGGNATERSRVVAECWKEAIETEDRWYTLIAVASSPKSLSYTSAWEEMNRLAGINLRAGDQ